MLQRCDRFRSPIYRIVLGVLSAVQLVGQESSQQADLSRRDEWSASHLMAENAALPFSFIVGDQPSEQFLRGCKRKMTKAKLDDARNEVVVAWSDAKTGLEVRCRAVTYASFPAVEWTLYFRNGGGADSPVIRDIQGIDASFSRKADSPFVLHTIRGDDCSMKSYEPLTSTLGPAKQSFASVGGRPTNGSYPFFNIAFDNGGVLAALGWPGQWAASFCSERPDQAHLLGGQEQTRMKLLPGEEIRAPLIALLFYSGDWISGQNRWRRWMVEHNIPRVGGKLPAPIYAVCAGLHPSEKGEIDNASFYVKYGCKPDYWWMDAGWYAGENWTVGRGTWEPDAQRFPKGIRAVSDYLHGKSTKLIVWFEPETVDRGTWLATAHPDWLLGGQLLNLGNPNALRWQCDHIGDFIAKHGIDLYRQDFNQDPLSSWRANDSADRQGSTENHHVQGYLAFYDSLRKRYPNMLIDSCASGGRRNDLETLRRAVPLLRSDFNHPQADGVRQYLGSKATDEDFITGNQGHTYGMSLWVPYFGSGEHWDDLYNFRSHLGMSICSGPKNLPIDLAYAGRVLDSWRSTIENSYGDYYPLTDYDLSLSTWMAWQYDRPEHGTGMVMAFRRIEAKEAGKSFKLHGLETNGVYEVTDFDREETVKRFGRDLMEPGLPLRLEPRQSAMIGYKLVRALTADAKADVTEGEMPLPVTFDGSLSVAPSSAISAYAWDFGDGTAGTGKNCQHSFDKIGTYRVNLTVTDEQKRTASAQISITVGPVDNEAPTIAEVRAAKSKLVVRFSEKVERTSAEDHSHYAIDRDIRPLTAKLAQDGRTLTLGVAALPVGDHALAAHDVVDRSRGKHAIDAGVTQKFRYDGLLARWKLDEGEGIIVRDQSINHLDGAIGGDPEWKDGQRGKSMVFDGKDDLVVIPTRLEQLNVPFSFTLWVNPASTQNEYADIFGNHDGFLGLVMQQDGIKTNRFGFAYGDGSRGYGHDFVQLAANQWQHLAIVCDGISVICSINGTERARGAGSGKPAPNPKLDLRIGQGFSTGRFFRGQICDVRMYETALTPAQITELASAPVDAR